MLPSIDPLFDHHIDAQEPPSTFISARTNQTQDFGFFYLFLFGYSSLSMTPLGPNQIHYSFLEAFISRSRIFPRELRG